MTIGALYAHTNLVARDWRTLAAFYEEVFGCEPVPPERAFPASVIEAGTGVPGASIEGVHLGLPGFGKQGPTLEVFSYSRLGGRGTPSANRGGFGHIAFQVPSVPDAREEVLSRRGSPVGEITTVEVSAGVRVTWCYVTDPEGNIVELQSPHR